ncbi:MAG: hypothetical protein Q8N84_03565 [bacterium]|nr:hypothetical protein [bacterium]
MFRQSKIKSYLLVGCLYFSLALVFTYPLVVNFGGKLVGADDANSHLWMGWWFHRALFVEHKNPLAWNNYLFYPDGFRLGSSYDGLIFPIFSLITKPFIGNQLAGYNLFCLLALSFSAWSVFVLVNSLVGSGAISFLAGLAVGFSPYQMAHLIGGHSNLILLGFVPLFLWRFLKQVHRPSNANLLSASLLLFLVGVGSWNYLLFTLLSLGAFLGGVYLANYRGKFDRFCSWITSIRIYFLLVIGGCLLLPLILPIVQGYFGGEVVTPVGSSYLFGSADLTSYFFPPPQSNLGRIFSTAGVYQKYFIFNQAEATTFLGWAEVILVAWLLLRKGWSRVAGKLWLGLASVAFLLSLGAKLYIFGRAYIPLPYLLLVRLPLGGLVRVPSRLSIFVLLFLVIFISLNTAAYFRKLKSWSKAVVWTLLFLGLVGVRLYLPFRMLEEYESPFYYQLRQDREAYVVANLPSFDAADTNVVANYSQTIHEKKMVGGYISTFSLTTRVGRFIIENPALYHSFCLSFNPEKASEIQTDQPLDRLFKVLSENNIRYLIVHKYLLARPECDFYKVFIEDYLRQKPVYFEDGYLRVYRTD